MIPIEVISYFNSTLWNIMVVFAFITYNNRERRQVGTYKDNTCLQKEVKFIRLLAKQFRYKLSLYLSETAYTADFRLSSISLSIPFFLPDF